LLAVLARELGFLIKEKISKKSFLKEDTFLGHSCQILAAKRDFLAGSNKMTHFFIFFHEYFPSLL